MRADNCIDRAGCAAMEATDAPRLIDDGDGRQRGRRPGEWQHVATEESGQPPDRGIAPGRTQVYFGFAGYDRLCIRTAARVSALCTLGLRQQPVRLLDEFALPRRQLECGVAEDESDKQGDGGYCQDGNTHSHAQARAIPAKPINASDMMPAVMSAIAAPRNGAGMSAASRRSRIDANMTSTSEKPSAAPKP